MRFCAKLPLALLLAAFFTSSAITPSFAQLSADIQAPGLQAQLKSTPSAPGVILTTPETEIARPRATEPRVKRARTVNVNGTYLRDMLWAPALTLDSAGKIKSDVKRHTLHIFDDLSVRVVKREQHQDSLGNMVWTGVVVDDPNGTALIVIHDNEMTAHIIAQGRSFTITPASDGTHIAREIEPRSIDQTDDETDARRPTIAPEDTSPTVVAPPSSQDEQPERAQAAYNLRVLIVYTPKAAARISNISSTASLAMSHLNTTLANSQIDVDATLAGLEQVNYTEGTSANQVLDDATNGVGDFARIQQVRAAVQADLVAVIADYGNSSCGVAWINDTLDRISNLRNYVKYGTSLINAASGCLPSTFTHEIGHNLGANHDRYVVDNDQPGPAAYNFGYVDTVGRFMDVMAYSNQCRDAGVSCSEIMVYSNPDLVASNGRPLGIPISQPEAAHATQRVREIAPRVSTFSTYLTTSNSPTLTTAVNGSGTVTSTPAGINCGGTCSVTVAQGTQITLTAVPARGWQFGGWTGECAGRITCTITLNANTSTTAVFERGLRMSFIYAGNPTDQSFIRFANSGSSAATATVVLSNFENSDIIGAWTTPSIPPRAAIQVPMSTIESGLYPGASRPAYYAASIRTAMSGSAQYVIYRPQSGSITNMTTCDSGTGAAGTQVANVHSSLIASSYPSTIVVINNGTSAATAQLGIYDANTGTRLTTYTTTSIPAGAQAVVPVTVMETTTGLVPNGSQYHYVIRFENTFNGTLQHIVTNLQNASTVDMTTVCTFGQTSVPTSTSTTRRAGLIFATAPGAPVSYMRFFNTGTTAGTVTVGLNNYLTGTRLGTWTSPSIPAGVAVQYPISALEASIPTTTVKPLYYSTAVQTQMTGSLAHVVHRAERAVLTNLSTCEATTTADQRNLFGVHSTMMDAAGYPSNIIITNTSTTAANTTLGIFDPRNAVRIGTYTTPTIGPLSQVNIPVWMIEQALGFDANTYQAYHYNVRAEGTFNGFMQAIVTNGYAGMLADTTASCALPVRVN